MARNRNTNNHNTNDDDLGQHPDEELDIQTSEHSETAPDTLDLAAGETAPEPTAESLANGEESLADTAPVLPTETDLESRGFSPDEVERLIEIADRLARSQESRDAEAALRRLRFTRWLVERGVLDEWSA